MNIMSQLSIMKNWLKSLTKQSTNTILETKKQRPQTKGLDTIGDYPNQRLVTFDLVSQHADWKKLAE